MGWIIKMLLKVFKPIAKIMILQALLEYFTNADGAEEITDDTTAAEEDTTVE